MTTIGAGRSGEGTCPSGAQPSLSPTENTRPPSDPLARHSPFLFAEQVRECDLEAAKEETSQSSPTFTPVTALVAGGGTEAVVVEQGSDWPTEEKLYPPTTDRDPGAL